MSDFGGYASFLITAITSTFGWYQRKFLKKQIIDKIINAWLEKN
jgi:hypothetical protein